MPAILQDSLSAPQGVDPNESPSSRFRKADLAAEFFGDCPPRAAFVKLLTAAFWPVLIYPKGAEKPGGKVSEGKDPIGLAWGLERWSLERANAEFRRFPGAGLGVCLGPGRAPGGGWLADLEGDGPQAEDSRDRLFGGEQVSTPGWDSSRGTHNLVLVDEDRIKAILPGIKACQVKKEGQPGVYKLDGFPDLEIRLGGYKSDGTIKQIQSVVPPTLGNDGKPRAWNGPLQVAAVPEAFYRNLEEAARLANASTRRTREPIEGVRDSDPDATSQRVTRYALAALAGECEKVASTAEGARHNALRDSSINMAGLVNGGSLAEHVYRNGLLDAAEKCGLDEADAVELIDSALKLATPRDLSEVRLWTPQKNGEAPSSRRGQTPVRGVRNGQASIPRPSGSIPVEPPSEDRVEAPDPPNCTDMGNARRMVLAFGEAIRYCVQHGKWLIWDGKRWKEDGTGEIYRIAMKTVQSILKEAAAVDDHDRRKELLKWEMQSEERKRIDAMIHLARFMEGIPVQASELDRDKWLLNARNGTIDLQTGRLRPHRQADLITKIIPVDFDPAATCPRWEKFELEIMDGDPEMVGYLRRIAGYGITGDDREHLLFFFYGEGRNGKSLWLKIIQEILADYYKTVDASLITVRHGQDHPTGLTELEGRRLVSTIEVEDGKKMAEALVKKLTGGDPVSARRMRQDFYEFQPTHKLILAANHKPEIRGKDRGIWDRVKLILFPCTFVDADKVDPANKLLLKDKDLAQALLRELPGILALLVRACLEWQQDGLKEPAAVEKATSQYRADMDELATFIEERCLVLESIRVKVTTLYEGYVAWAKASGLHPMKSRDFAPEMEKRGFKAKKSNSVSWRYGIALRDEASVEEGPDESEPARSFVDESDWINQNGVF